MAKRKKKKHRSIKIERVKPRNPFATPARLRSGAGLHTDKRKERARKRCRGKVQDD